MTCRPRCRRAVVSQISQAEGTLSTSLTTGFLGQSESDHQGLTVNHRPATADATAIPNAAQPKVRSSSPDIAAKPAQTPKHRDATATPAAGRRSINRSRKAGRAFDAESRGTIMTIQEAAPSEPTHASRTNNQFNALPTQADKLLRCLEP